MFAACTINYFFLLCMNAASCDHQRVYLTASYYVVERNCLRGSERYQHTGGKWQLRNPFLPKSPPQMKKNHWHQWCFLFPSSRNLPFISFLLPPDINIVTPTVPGIPSSSPHHSQEKSARNQDMYQHQTAKDKLLPLEMFFSGHHHTAACKQNSSPHVIGQCWNLKVALTWSLIVLQSILGSDTLPCLLGF